MKKIFILATAAIVAFASCMKTEIVSNSEPQEIAFRQFTGSMTKADPTDLASFASTMGVFGYHNNSGTTALYINNGIFKHSTDGKWGGEPTKYYWPLQGTMDFTVYAPYVDGTSYNNETKVLTVAIAANNENQYDYLYGKKQYVSSKPATPASGVGVVLKHALSKVTINVNANEPSVFTVSKVTLKSTKQSGTYTVTYTGSEESYESVVAPNDENIKDMEYVSGTAWNIGTEVGTNTNSKLVVPSDQTSIVIEYNMAGSVAKLQATVDLTGGTSKWETGKHYTYNITLKADEILLVPTVQGWDDQTASGITVPEVTPVP